jgi:hypothetical protein
MVIDIRVLRYRFGRRRNEVPGEEKATQREVQSVLLTKYYSDGQVRGMKWVGLVACLGYRRGVQKGSVGNLKEKDHLESPSVDGRIILKLILMKLDGRHGCLKIGTGGWLLWVL